MQSLDSPLSPASCRAARYLLKLSQEDLAHIAGVSLSTLRRFESDQVQPNEYASGQILAALEREGIIFIGAGSEPALR